MPGKVYSLHPQHEGCRGKTELELMGTILKKLDGEGETRDESQEDVPMPMRGNEDLSQGRSRGKGRENWARNI
jgi:hypothetical protein